MTTYNRYVIADGGTTTLDELRHCLQEFDAAYDFDGELITHDGVECGILIDVTKRGDPIFDGDIELLATHANNDQDREEIHRALDRSTCMVTTQVDSQCDERALESLWEWLRKNKKGILVCEGGSFRIDK